MLRTFLNITVLFIVMILLQVVVCNRIILFNVAVPLVFIYFIIRQPMWLPTYILLTLSFLLGLTIDIFSDTPGLNALGCTVIAMLKRPLFFAYVEKDDNTDNIVPSIKSIGFGAYSKYMLSMVAIFCTIVFSIEYFSFAAVKEIAIMVVSSSLFTFVILLGIDSLMSSPREKRL